MVSNVSLSISRVIILMPCLLFMIIIISDIESVRSFHLWVLFGKYVYSTCLVLGTFRAIYHHSISDKTPRSVTAYEPLCGDIHTLSDTHSRT